MTAIVTNTLAALISRRQERLLTLDYWEQRLANQVILALSGRQYSQDLTELCTTNISLLRLELENLGLEISAIQERYRNYPEWGAW